AGRGPGEGTGRRLRGAGGSGSVRGWTGGTRGRPVAARGAFRLARSPPRTLMDWATRYRRTADEPPEAPATPDEAARRLLDGNAEFVREAAPDVPAPSTAGPPGESPPAPPRQAPFCIVLGCSDARVPSELLFGTGPNQQFVVRVAGNVLADECLGSIEYALHTFRESVHLLVVLGHTR